MKIRFYAIAVMAMLMLGVNTASAQVSEDSMTFVINGLALKKVCHRFYYGDTLAIIHRAFVKDAVTGKDTIVENVSGLYEKDQVITINRDDILCSSAPISAYVDVKETIIPKTKVDTVVYRLTTADSLAIVDAHLSSPAFIDSAGVNIFKDDIELAKLNALKKAYISTTDVGYDHSENVVINGGKYEWRHGFVGTDQPEMNTVTINTPEMIFLDNGSFIPNATLSRGHIYVLKPYLRSGYPYNLDKYRGEAKWSIIEDKDKVLKSGTYNLNAQNADYEYVDSLDFITDFVTDGDSITFTVTFNDQSTTSYVMHTSEHVHNFSEELTFDEENHWYAAICNYNEECKTAKKGENPHKFLDDKSQVGYFRCVCKYIDTAREQESADTMKTAINSLLALSTLYLERLADNYKEELQHAIDTVKSVTDTDGVTMVQLYTYLVDKFKTTTNVLSCDLAEEYMTKGKAIFDEDTYSEYEGEILHARDKRDTYDRPVWDLFEEIYNKYVSAAIRNVNQPETSSHNKYMYRGSIVIERNGKKYTVNGTRQN